MLCAQMWGVFVCMVRVHGVCMYDVWCGVCVGGGVSITHTTCHSLSMLFLCAFFSLRTESNKRTASMSD